MPNIELAKFAASNPDVAARLTQGVTLENYAILHSGPHENATYLDFRVLKTDGVTPGGDVTYESWWDGTLDIVDNPWEADIFIEGSIKWDGCANLTFGEGDESLHFCGYNDVMSLGRLLARMYKLCAEHMGQFDAAVAEMPGS